MTTNYYISVGRGQGTEMIGLAIGLHAGTSSTSTDDVEVRMQIVRADASISGLTSKDVILALDKFRQYVLSNGLGGPNSVGTDIPSSGTSGGSTGV